MFEEQHIRDDAPLADNSASAPPHDLQMPSDLWTEFHEQGVIHREFPYMERYTRS